MRSFISELDRRDMVLYAGGLVLAIILTILWDLFLEPVVSNMFPDNAQVFNKYLLAVLIVGLAAVVALVSLVAAQRSGGLPTRNALIAGVLVRFGIALELLGITIIPIALYYSSDPTRSVPIGFAAFTAVFAGLFLAGIGGNMLAPRRV
jgi:hypothetical protein